MKPKDPSDFLRRCRIPILEECGFKNLCGPNFRHHILLDFNYRYPDYFRIQKVELSVVNAKHLYFIFEEWFDKITFEVGHYIYGLERKGHNGGTVKLLEYHWHPLSPIDETGDPRWVHGPHLHRMGNDLLNDQSLHFPTPYLGQPIATEQQVQSPNDLIRVLVPYILEEFLPLYKAKYP